MRTEDLRLDPPRAALRAALLAHECAGETEERDREAMLALVQTEPACFARTTFDPGHFTGSAVVVNPTGTLVCLILHAKLGRWLQPGGHADPADGGDLGATALREAHEETGLDVSLHPNAPRPLDVDAHVIPARKDEPEHRHLDVRFLVVASNPEALSRDPAETHGAQWLTWEDATSRADEPPLRRLLSKAQHASRRHHS